MIVDVLKECENSENLLKTRQGYSLNAKIYLTKQRIKEWYEYYNGDVYVSFSGGKDSTVLLHLVRSLYPDVVAVFVDTGLEFPEIKSFVKETPNTVTVRPKMVFSEVIIKYGFPVVSKENAQKIYDIRNTKSLKLLNKRLYGDEKGNGKLPKKWKFLINEDFKISERCCDVMKKRPVKKYEKETHKKPFIGTMVVDSFLRRSAYLKKGCNSFKYKRPVSTPMAFWLEKDVWEYIQKEKLPYSKVYDMGYDRTGCMFCMFGVHLEKGTNRFQRMKKTHPKLWDYCINKLGCGKVLKTINVESA